MTRNFRFLTRSLAIISAWLLTVGFFAIAFFMGGKREPSAMEISNFTSAFAIASTVAVLVVLIVVGRWRWAVAVTLPIFTLVITTLTAGCVAFFVVSPLGQSLLQMPAPRALEILNAYSRHARGIANSSFQTRIVLALVFGVIAGLLFSLARRWPRLIAWLIVGLLLSCVIGSMHIDAFKQVTDLVMKTRLGGATNLHFAWFMTLELLSAIGATAGAFVGAVIACAAVWIDRKADADFVHDSPSES